MLNEKYDPKISEKKWQNYWLDYGKKLFLQTNQPADLKLSVYSFLNDKERNQTFVIDTPPPTVSGLLHMGHIFSYTQADFVARFNRMQGKDVFYPMGFDDNGLPTERLVEKVIGKKAMIYEQEMQQKNQGGSGYFVEKCKEIVEQSEQEFEQLFKQIALSVDWQQKYQTISAESQKISQASFVDLFNKGLVEKQNQPVYWDISDRTALAQADIIDKEVEGEMFFIDFKIQGSDDPLEIMTTRPELLPACVAVMINGQDQRYQNLIKQPLNQEGEGETGSFAITPLFGVIVPIIADNSVQIDKGTGVVMCCTFGDEMDLKWWRKYRLPLREIINQDGSIKNLRHDQIDGIFSDDKTFRIKPEFLELPENFLKKYNEIRLDIDKKIRKIKDSKKIIIELLEQLPSFNSPLEGESKSQSDFGGGSKNNFAQRNYELKNLTRSKELRSNMTDHEKILWYKINNNQLGYKFRKQQPIGNYIVDFVCFEKNLIIELDGSGHAEKIEYDANRDQFLQNQGFRILRLWNNECLEDVDAIVDYIVKLLNDTELTPHQNRFAILTPPQGGSLNPSSDLNSNQQNQTLALIKSQKITRAVKCAERSGVPIEIISTSQWFIKILDFKEQLKKQAQLCNWYPDYMRVRIEQWIDGLSWDWCISRQRFFGVKFPVWRVMKKPSNPRSIDQLDQPKFIIATINQLNQLAKQNIALDPEIHLPEGFKLVKDFNQAKKDYEDLKKILSKEEAYFIAVKDGVEYMIYPETDVMDTWMTSSISPQLSSKGISDDICFNQSRHQKLFPADMRPQAHEIIRTWAFYTIVKAYFHSLNIIKNAQGEIEKNVDGSIKLIENSNPKQSIPWQSLMISGWCLASDKTKMSKSKGNVITPQSLIEEKSADVVRYWASASSLGADIAYSEEVFKIGQKLITKIYNSAKFCSQHFAILKDYFKKNKIDQSNQNYNDQNLIKLITHDSDLWILSKISLLIKNYNQQFEIYEYGKARELLEEFFWHYFCDNYLEICKVRSYGLEAQKYQTVELDDNQKNIIINNQISALITLNLLLKNILKLFAPFLPHLCEDIYSQIFVDEFNQKYSIHARGNHPQIFELNLNQLIDYQVLGSKMLEVIFDVRKYKSQKNLSMKFVLNSLEIPDSFNLNSVADDLENVCNSQKIIFSNCQELLII